MTKIKPNEIFKITIKSWEKYQSSIRQKPRSKANWTFSDFLFSNNFFDDIAIINAGAMAQQVFIFLLTQCSQNDASTIATTCQAIASRLTAGRERITRRSASSVLGDILKLQTLGLVELISIPSPIPIPNPVPNPIPGGGDNNIGIPRSIISISHPHPPPNKPMSLDPFAPKPDETPYAEIINLWNQICVPPKRRIEIFQAGPMRQEWIKQHWLKHPDIAHWEAWMRAYAKSFWVLDPNERDNPKCPEFYKLLEKPDLIYGLLDGSYAFVDVEKVNQERERKERISLLEAIDAEEKASRSRGA